MGHPSQAANISDALDAYDWLRARGVEPGDIVLYGESLGTGVAVQVAAGRDIAGLILDAPYSSLAAVAQEAYPYFPVRHFLKDQYLSDRFIAKIDAPLLILHGARDEVISVAFGRELFEAAIEPKKIVVFPKGNHSDLYDHGAMDEVRGFIDSLNR